MDPGAERLGYERLNRENYEMADEKKITPLSLAVSAALAASLGPATASADDGLFSMTSLAKGTMIQTIVGDGDGEGSCGGDDEAEGSCGDDAEGEGSCGDEAEGEGEGSCGGDDEGEGSCGGDDEEAEGSCGEGRCGAA